MKNGRFIVTPSSDPYFNMALDEWLFVKFCENPDKEGAILRLYSWKSEAITIGYNQDVKKTVNNALLERETPVLKRITGGRAIYHDSTEITFSLIIGLNNMPDSLRSLSASNRLISQTLIEIFTYLGLKLNWDKGSNVRADLRETNLGSASCFNSVSRYELTSGPNKIAAGAQRRTGNAMIHQGSIKINGIAACPAINQRGDIPKPMIAYQGKRPFVLNDFNVFFKDGFTKHFGINFQQSEISSSELKLFTSYLKKYTQNSFEIQRNI